MTYKQALAKIKTARLALGMSQAAAADKYGCRPTTWNQWERGRRTMSMGVLKKMGAVVGLDIVVEAREAEGEGDG